MKKLITTLIIAMSVVVFVSCNNKTWYTALGNASFATDKIWTISGNGITQIWSDAVQTDYCSNKTSFDGGDFRTSTFNIDCRSNPEFSGDLFSWQAVYELRDELCPYPWRVPTMEDFVDLDIALGGTGRWRQATAENAQFVVDNYINRWGGAFGGICGSNGTLHNQGLWGHYWSLSDENVDFGFRLRFTKPGLISPEDVDGKGAGFSLRCIR
ncbi:MAG: fibrobacter succinogenes major paralogous domain-containing protein [Bacteroidales bacterium]|nr:fibrobacter succinogenes major paralogous domain-containing protein [Bacteroidales bacterium]